MTERPSGGSEGIVPPAPVIIACAMKEEAEPFLQALTPHPKIQAPTLPHDYRGPAVFTAGLLGSHPTIVATTGIGMTNAALAATVSLTQVRPRAYILAGTTGGLATTVNLGHTIVADSALYHDADASGFGYAPGQIPQMPEEYEADAHLVEQLRGLQTQATDPMKMHVGPVSSSNSFVTAHQVPAVTEAFPHVLAVDMETAAAAQVCWAFAVPWVSVRAVSDMCDPNAGEVFMGDAPNAVKVSYNLVVQLLQSLEEQS